MKHQREGVDFLKATPYAAIFDEPGLGKSAQALLGATEPILVVAPAMVIAGGVWDDEIALWRPDADVTQVTYGKLAALQPRKWGTLVLDEAHYVKNRKAQRTRAVMRIAPKCERVILLTGTPLPNWASEAFTLLQLIYPEETKPGQRLGSYWRWVAEWFDVAPSRFSGHDIGGLRADRAWEQFVAENWGDRCIRRLRDDCLDLPPLTIQQMMVDMVPAQAAAYRQLKRDFITWLDSGAEISAWSKAGQLVKLAQTAAGLDVLDPTVEASGKLDALEALLADRPYPTLVVGHFRATVEACARRAARAGKRAIILHGGVSHTQRGAAVRSFQAGEVAVLCATIDTISEGLTLNQADQVIRVERSWRPSRNEQVIRRCHRIGQTRPVSVIDLVTRDSVDERVLTVLAAKNDQQAKALLLQNLREVV